jgi:hypothetical protein
LNRFAVLDESRQLRSIIPEVVNKFLDCGDLRIRL